MGSKKRSSWSKQKAEFNASLGGMDRQQKTVLKKKQHYARKPASRKIATRANRTQKSQLPHVQAMELPACTPIAALTATAGTLPLSQNENSNPSVILAEPTNPIID
ncbi:MAG: hypothetical protein BHV62_00035 [Eggerthella sp. 51_9]|nr:MAG: hypothetical protein BHV62_00035 [Eggerthella sp. 51_9]